MSISKQLLQHVENALSIRITTQVPVSGGSINQTYQLQTKGENYFIKINDKNRFPAMFEAEAKGLKVIGDTNTIAVPKVILNGEAGNNSFLVLEWLESIKSNNASSQVLGRQLAQMHKVSDECFGLDHDNYMGSLAQFNLKHKLWSTFFVEERLTPMVKIARDNSFLDSQDMQDFNRLYKSLPDLFDEEPPSLLHGDLWGGNYLIADNGTPYLIDPAVSFGFRESDIAMTTLFGGFSKDFYRVYHEEFPLSKGWEQRIDLWNLYPLLVHLNLFGEGYLHKVKSCLRKYL